MDRNQPPAASAAILGCRWLWTEDLSVCAAFSASSEFSRQTACSAISSRSGHSRRLHGSSAHDTRSPTLFQLHTDRVAPVRGVYAAHVRFVHDGPRCFRLPLKLMTRRELLGVNAAAGAATFISRKGDAVHGARNIKSLFIAGFGQIVR